MTGYKIIAGLRGAIDMAKTATPDAAVLDVTLCFRRVTPERALELIRNDGWSAAARADLFSERDALKKERDEALAENAKLREALERIAVPANPLPDDEDADGWVTLASDRREIARAALSAAHMEDGR